MEGLNIEINLIIMIRFFNLLSTKLFNLCKFVLFLITPKDLFYFNLEAFYYGKIFLFNSIRTQKVKNLTEQHGFHLVNPSPWPVLVSLSALSVTLGNVLYFHLFERGFFLVFCGFLFLLICKFYWFNDVVLEATYEGHHTSFVQKGLRLGMLLFIVSEIMFFFSFFWALYHSALVPTFQVGAIWPILGIDTPSSYTGALFNTCILLLSGASVTWAHSSILEGDRVSALKGLLLTIFLGFFFTCSQAFEYISLPVSINDSIYGSIFYMATGFHGFHVIIGTIFLLVCFIRLYHYDFTKEHHFGFEAAGWYWHFVDVVWIFLFISLYWWTESDVVESAWYTHITPQEVK